MIGNMSLVPAVCALIFLGAIASPSQAAEHALQSVQPARQDPDPLVVLTNAEQVHRLTREEAEHDPRAVIQGVVICSLPEWASAVVQDSTRGIYVDHLSPALGQPPRMGEWVEIEGVAQPGYFAPFVQARRMTRFGEGQLPQPIHPTWDQLINGS